MPAKSDTHAPRRTSAEVTAPRRRNGEAQFRTLDDLPVTLTLYDVCAVYRRARSTILRDVRLGLFLPAPFDKRPYRWRKEDVEADLAQKAAAARERVEATLMKTVRLARRQARAETARA
jgi:hypothetical protein